MVSLIVRDEPSPKSHSKPTILPASVSVIISKFTVSPKHSLRHSNSGVVLIPINLFLDIDLVHPLFVVKVNAIVFSP